MLKIRAILCLMFGRNNRRTRTTDKMENEPQKKSLIPKMTKFGKWVALVMLAFILIWPLSAGLYWSVYKAYTIIDPTRFPELDQKIAVLLQNTTPDSDMAFLP